MASEIRALEGKLRSQAHDAALAQQSLKDMLEAELLRREREVADLRRQLQSQPLSASAGPSSSARELLFLQEELRATQRRMQVPLLSPPRGKPPRAEEQ